MAMGRLVILWFAAGVVWGIAVLGAAQDVEPREETAEETVTTTPPTLQTFVDAEYDPELLEPGDQIEVILTLTINAEGQVSNAEVFQSGGEPFDTAAVAASNALGKSKLILNQRETNATSFNDLFLAFVDPRSFIIIIRWQTSQIAGSWSGQFYAGLPKTIN